ncbi:MAG: nitrilase-related carbon-nitrogen hydrolase, partial [Micromonosporaceae bacterium]
MSYGDGLIAPHEVRPPRPDFELTRRGYDKRQVDTYVARVGRELATLASERDQAYRQVRELAAQLERVQAELNELRQRPPKIERASFQDLGPTVGQILDLAEKQARDIRTLAEERAARQKAEAEKLLAEARQEAERLRAEGEAVYERAEQEARRLAEQGAQQLEQARAEADELLEAARAQAREEIEAARAQTQQEIQARQQAIARLEAELDGLTVGLVVCYDVEFPENVRAHALAGTDLLVVPTALMHPYQFVAEALVPVRAFESQMY